MSTKLTDFTFKELVFLSIQMEEAQKDALSKIEMIEKFDDSATKTELIAHHNRVFEMASQWRTQVETAMIKVKYDEILKSN